MSFPMSERYGYILTIEERYWNRFCRLNKAGKAKHAYVSSADILRDYVKAIFFYSVHPHKEILGCADLTERRFGNPLDLWKDFGQETCFNSLDEYLGVTRGKPRITFVRFENFHEGSEMVTFEQFSTVLAVERMPQTGMYIDKTQAMKLIELLK